MKWREWDLNLKIRLLGEGVINLFFWALFPFMAFYFSQAFGKNVAGLLMILSQFVGVIANLFGGYFADRFGRKRMMLISAFGQGLTFIFFAYANSPWYDSPILSFICFSMIGAFGSLYWPASEAMIADLVDKEHRSAIFAAFYTSMNVTVVIGPILGSIFFYHYRFYLLIASASAVFILSILMLRFVRETMPVKRMTDPQMEKKLNWLQFLFHQLKDYRVIVQDKVFLLFILAGILLAQTFMQMDMLLAVYINDSVPYQEVLHIGNWKWSIGGKDVFGWIIAENGLLVALFTLWATKKTSEYSVRNIFISSAFIYAVAILLFGMTNNIWVIFIAMIIFTVAELIVVGVQQSFVSELAPDNMRGQYFAASSLRFTIGRTIAPLSIPVSNWIGYPWTFSILSILAVIAGVVYFIMFKFIGSPSEVK